MALGLTQSQTEISTRKLPSGKRRLPRKADNLTAISEPTVQKIWQPRHLTTLWASMACYRETFTFFFLTYNTETWMVAKGQKSKIQAIDTEVLRSSEGNRGQD
jgi:hypothetical protein